MSNDPLRDVERRPRDTRGRGARVGARGFGNATTRVLVVVLVASFALLGLARPVLADAGWDEAVRRKLWDDADAASHWDEIVREVVWGWSPHSGADGWFEAVRRAVWHDWDGRGHWDEAVRRYLWDQAHPTPASMLAAASAYQYEPEVWTISPTACACDTPGRTVLGATWMGVAVVLFPAAFANGQAYLNYVVAHESGHLWDHDHDISVVITEIATYPRATPDPTPELPDDAMWHERYADCYAQKKGLTRPANVGYWTCPPAVLALVTF